MNAPVGRIMSVDVYPAPGDARGYAHGWRVDPDKAAGWRWSAYGPRGSELGIGDTEEKARVAAIQAYRRLTVPL